MKAVSVPATSIKDIVGPENCSKANTQQYLQKSLYYNRFSCNSPSESTVSIKDIVEFERCLKLTHNYYKKAIKQ